MRRGDLVTVAVQGDFGKPRPALIIQSDAFNQDHSSIAFLPITSSLVAAPLFRIELEPDDSNGLRTTSQIMVDKIMTARRDKLGKRFGRVSDRVLLEVNRSMAIFLGIA